MWFLQWFSLACSVFVGLSDIVEAVSTVRGLNRDYDVCGVQNGRRIYLEQGHNGIIRAGRVTLTQFSNSQADENVTEKPSKHIQQCDMEFVTCSSCAIQLVAVFLNFSESCLSRNQNQECDCDYLEISEPPYEGDLFGQRLCQENRTITSRTRTIHLRFLYTQNYENAFAVEYRAEKNMKMTMGNPGTSNQKTTVSTPFFPAYYPRDFENEQHFKCLSNQACRIHVNFIDFQISPSSVLELSEGNDSTVLLSGPSRPPVFITSGATLSIKFKANGATALGYQALVSFILLTQVQEIRYNPRTDCGGYVESIGGAITMMRMISNATVTQYFDCIWIIRPSNKYLHLKTHLSLRIDTFDKFSQTSELVIRQGMTSDGPVLGTIAPSYFNSPTSFAVALSSGYYVRLRGEFNYKTSLAIVYTVFSYSECYMGSEFTCQNHRCIPIQLHCDSFDHCGDNSDEPASCQIEWDSEPVDRRWYSHTPNYYFPKMEQYSDLKTATIVFITSSLGLISLIAFLIFVLYRMGSRARHQRELQNHLSSAYNQNHRSREIDVIDAEPPPVYEAPPDYEEVIKIGMEKEIRRSRRRQREESRGRRNERRTSEQPILEISAEDTNTHANANPPIVNPETITDLLSRPLLIETSTSTAPATHFGFEQQIGPKAVSSYCERLSPQSEEMRSDFEYYRSLEQSLSLPPIITTSAPVVASTSGLGVKNSMRSPWLVFRNGEPTPISLSSVDCVQMPEFNGFLIHYGPEIKSNEICNNRRWLLNNSVIPKCQSCGATCVSQDTTQTPPISSPSSSNDLTKPTVDILLPTIPYSISSDSISSSN